MAPTETTPQTFTFGEDDYLHRVGDPDCDAGWCGGGKFPRPCTSCDGGLIHANWGDEDRDGYWLFYLCDKCGKTDRPSQETQPQTDTP